jgi:ABC-2 type transport system permease protein
LLLGGEIGGTGLIAVGWCAAITLVGHLWAKRLYDRDPAR